LVPFLLVLLNLRKKKQEVEVLFCPNAKIGIEDFDKTLYLLQFCIRSINITRTIILPCKFK